MKWNVRMEEKLSHYETVTRSNRVAVFGMAVLATLFIVMLLSGCLTPKTSVSVPAQLFNPDLPPETPPATYDSEKNFRLVKYDYDTSGTLRGMTEIVGDASSVVNSNHKGISAYIDAGGGVLIPVIGTAAKAAMVP